jgi:hypothetical protein
MIVRWTGIDAMDAGRDNPNGYDAIWLGYDKPDGDESGDLRGMVCPYGPPYLVETDG